MLQTTSKLLPNYPSVWVFQLTLWREIGVGDVEIELTKECDRRCNDYDEVHLLMIIKNVCWNMQKMISEHNVQFIDKV